MQNFFLFPATSARQGIISILFFHHMLDHIQISSFKRRLHSSAFLLTAFHEVHKCVRQKVLKSWRPPSVVCEWLAEWATGATGPSVQPKMLPALPIN